MTLPRCRRSRDAVGQPGVRGSCSIRHFPTSSVHRPSRPDGQGERAVRPVSMPSMLKGVPTRQRTKHPGPANRSQRRLTAGAIVLAPTYTARRRAPQTSHTNRGRSTETSPWTRVQSAPSSTQSLTLPHRSQRIVTPTSSVGLTRLVRPRWSSPLDRFVVGLSVRREIGAHTRADSPPVRI